MWGTLQPKQLNLLVSCSLQRCACPAANYTPFQTLGGNTQDTMTMGYTYSGARSESSGGNPRRVSRGQMLAVDGITTPDAAKAAVRVALHEWSGNYTGYAWAVRFQELNEHQLEIPAHVYVFLNKPGATISALPSKVEDFNDLRMHPNYCGSASGFNDYTHEHAAHTVVNRAVDLTDCLLKAAMDPNVPAANPTDLSRGPAKVRQHGLLELSTVFSWWQPVMHTDRICSKASTRTPFQRLMPSYSRYVHRSLPYVSIHLRCPSGSLTFASWP